MDLPDSALLAASGCGMLLVAAISVMVCRFRAASKYRWLWIGAGLWTIAVVLKIVASVTTYASILAILEQSLPRPAYLVAGSLFVGVASAFFEIGLTLVAVLVWRELGQFASKAIGIGLGAGAFEAAVLGLSVLSTSLVVYLGVPGTEKVSEAVHATGASAFTLCLVPPIERTLAILCHTSSRALVLLGVAHRRWAMVLAGAAIFSFIDSVAGFAHLSGALQTYSVWWTELAIAPAALISIPAICWCAKTFPVPNPPDIAPDVPPNDGN